MLGVVREQVISIAVFSAIILGALLYWRFRLAFALLGLGTLFAAGLLDIPHFIQSSGLDIIMFLVGMMIIIGFLEERHFFEVLLERIMRFAGVSAKKTVALLMMMAALSAALVDEVTSILFIASTAIHLATRLGIRVIPLVMMSVFATVIGSSATVIGNPVGVIIALKVGVGFSDFLRWATPISIIGLSLCIPLAFSYFRGFLKEMDIKMRIQAVQTRGEGSSSSPHAKIGLVPILLFLGTLTGLIFHTQVEQILGLRKNTMLVGVAVMAAGISLFLEKEKARELVERRVDWWTLTFFLAFFSSVGTLEFTGVTKLLARLFLSAGGGDFLITFLLTGWAVGLMSAVMDNVLAVTLWIPIVNEMGATGLNIFPLWWVMLFGGTFMGNLTFIGSTANIVAVGLIERRKMGHITLRQWIAPGALISFTTFSLALLLLYLQVPLMGG